MQQKVIVSLVLVVMLVAGGFASRWYCRSSTYTKAKGYMEKGYLVLAYETLLLHKDHYVSEMESCDNFIRASVATADPNKIAWVSESCHANGIEQYSTFMGLAMAQKNRGNVQGAISIISNSIQKFEKQADPYYLLAKFFIELKNNDQGGNMFFEAFRRAEDNGNLAVEALQFFIGTSQLERAVYVIDKLKSKQINNPEVLLLMALGLKRAGKGEDAKVMVMAADTAMKEAPAGRVQAIKNQFAEVYAADEPAPGPTGKKK